MNFLVFLLSTSSDFVGSSSRKLWDSCFPTLAPDGAHALATNFLSVVTSTSIVLFPLLLKTILALISEINGILLLNLSVLGPQTVYVSELRNKELPDKWFPP